mmetsp:Transcript_21546/g.3524  ORF Transcript_21546/g.3524 Transcript_21546/m.3524 type:complete len:88 (-) Transcript_21546:55-318(-)
MVIGAIYDDTGSYTDVSLFLFLVGICGIVCGIFLIFADRAKGGVLNSSDPRQAMLNCLKDDDSLVDPDFIDKDLPDIAKEWLSSPES